MATHRISIDIDEDEHKYLKLCCVKLGVSIKSFVLQSVNQRIEEAEDHWLLDSESSQEDQGENFVLIDHKGNLNAIPS